MSFFECVDSTCSKFGIPIYSERRFMFYHYYQKSRSRLVDLVLLHSLLLKPHSERTITLANILTDFSGEKN